MFNARCNRILNPEARNESNRASQERKTRIRTLTEANCLARWRSLALKFLMLMDYLNLHHYYQVLLGPHFHKLHWMSAEEEDVMDEWETVGTSDRSLPQFTRVITHTDQKQYVVGKRLTPGTGRIDLQNKTHDATVCQHPDSAMKGRGGNKGFLWWLCSACVERWERIPIENYQKDPRETATDHDLITFGQYMGRPYGYIIKKDKHYCEWIIHTAEMDQSASMQLKRLANYLVNKQLQMGGFPEPQAGNLDEEL